MKTIIHPTDFSENAAKALDFAIGIADKNDAALFLLHVIDLPSALNIAGSLSMFSVLEEEIRTSTIDRLKKYAASNKKTTDYKIHIQFKVKLNSSTVKDGIVEAIDETDADLVVMGTKGESRLKRFIMGSTTKAMISKSPCPVLAVPEKAVYKGINHIVYASDFNPNDLEVIQHTTDIARKNDAEISVLHISKKNQGVNLDAVAFQRWLSEVVKYSRLKFTTRVSDNIARSIVRYLKDNQVDLLVFFEKQNSFIDRLFHKGTVKQFVDYSVTIPLMSYNIHSIGNSDEKKLF